MLHKRDEIGMLPLTSWEVGSLGFPVLHGKANHTFASLVLNLIGHEEEAGFGVLGFKEGVE